MVIDLNDTYGMPMIMIKMRMVMIIILKTQNGHNVANFEATFSRFCMVIGLNDIYRMMTTMMIMMIRTIMIMMKMKITKIAIFSIV